MSAASVALVCLLLSTADAQTVFVTATVRDFTAASLDFARAEVAATDTATGQIVTSTLVNDKPVRSGAAATSVTAFDTWFAEPADPAGFTSLTLPLTAASASVYQFSGNPFLPINDPAFYDVGTTNRCD